MIMLDKRLRAAVLVVAGFGLALPAAAAGDGYSLLRGLDKGAWQIKYREGGKAQRLCVKSGMELLSIGNPPSGCRRFVVKDSEGSLDVQLTCPGRGYARTSLRKETGSLVQVEAQGVRNGAPYSVRGEARRTGSC